MPGVSTNGTAVLSECAVKGGFDRYRAKIQSIAGRLRLTVLPPVVAVLSSPDHGLTTSLPEITLRENTMHQKTIMAIDDTPDNLALLELTLSTDYQVVTGKSGKECLDSVDEVKPDLILLDVHMPEMNGFEVCKALKESENTSTIPVIFLSAGDSLDEKMAGYEAGADDYITKPYVEEEILAKINASLNNSSINQRLKLENKDAMETAFVAMNTAAELGIIIRFLQESGAADSFDSLMALFFDATEYFRLNCCAQIRTKKGDLSIRCENDSLEAQILKKMRNQGKIYDLGPVRLLMSRIFPCLSKICPLTILNAMGA